MKAAPQKRTRMFRDRELNSWLLDELLKVVKTVVSFQLPDPALENFRWILMDAEKCLEENPLGRKSMKHYDDCAPELLHWGYDGRATTMEGIRCVRRECAAIESLMRVVEDRVIGCAPEFEWNCTQWDFSRKPLNDAEWKKADEQQEAYHSGWLPMLERIVTTENARHFSESLADLQRERGLEFSKASAKWARRKPAEFITREEIALLLFWENTAWAKLDLISPKLIHPLKHWTDSAALEFVKWCVGGIVTLDVYRKARKAHGFTPPRESGIECRVHDFSTGRLRRTAHTRARV